MKLCTPFLEWCLSFITFLCFFTECSYITLPCVSKHSIWLGLSLTFNEPLDDRRRSSCFFAIFCWQNSTISFAIHPTHDMEFWDFKMLMLLKFYLFLSVVNWIFSSVFCSHLIQIQKIIPVTFWNAVNIWPIWWECVCYGHQLIEFSKNCNRC